MNATAIIGIVILVLFVGSFIAYGVVLYLGREHKQTVLVKSKYTTKNRRQKHGGTVVHYAVVCKCGAFNRKFSCSHRVYEHMREGQSYLAKTKMGEILSLHNQ